MFCRRRVSRICSTSPLTGTLRVCRRLMSTDRNRSIRSLFRTGLDSESIRRIARRLLSLAETMVVRPPEFSARRTGRRRQYWLTVPIILQGGITVSNTSSTNSIIMSGNISGSGNINIINTSPSLDYIFPSRFQIPPERRQSNRVRFRSATVPQRPRSYWETLRIWEPSHFRPQRPAVSDFWETSPELET